tara:strand:+ start:306 stop:494 length:189 start_codon:yes stop_codon:yes gene_type:complete
MEELKICFSIIFGLVIAFLFKSVYEKRNVIIINSKILDNIKENTYKYKEKCFKYDIKNTNCH